MVFAALAIISAACARNSAHEQRQSLPPVVANDSISPGFFTIPPGARPVNAIRRIGNARPSYAWRINGGKRELVAFSTPIQHVVVIYMENRTPENLFGAYFSVNNPSTNNTFGHDLDLVNPTSVHLTPKPLDYMGNPNHEHEPGFTDNVSGTYPKGFWYVSTPGPSVDNYITIIEKWAYENHTLQSNEGPSLEAHQYAIAAQSGGLSSSDIAPRGMANNPTPNAGAAPTPTATADNGVGTGTCYAGNSEEVLTTDMTTPYPGNQTTSPSQPSSPPASPCNEYPTILHLIANTGIGILPYNLWQYVAKDKTSIWSAPMAVRSLYNAYSTSSNVNIEPFAIDPDAENFVLNVSNSTAPTPNPVRPFAELTFLTPCVAESDHPNPEGTGPNGGTDEGPQWLAYVLNAIGTSSYWNNTAVIVTWDDWGGFYDNYTPAPWPFHPAANGYGNPQDPNEWGYRVPLMMISPYVTSRGYISTTMISQGAILNYIENTFGLGAGALGGDDAANGTHHLIDMLNYNRTPLPWITLSTTFTPANDGTCPKYG